jgi:hypothetical protein
VGGAVVAFAVGGEGFALTGHFLLKGLEPVLFGQALPAARMRLIDMLNDKA